MSREKYSCYEFEIDCERIPVWSQEGRTDKHIDGFTYKIYYWHDYYGCEDNISSDEWYYSKDEANNAAIDHIDLLENGEG